MRKNAAYKIANSDIILGLKYGMFCYFKPILDFYIAISRVQIIFAMGTGLLQYTYKLLQCKSIIINGFFTTWLHFVREPVASLFTTMLPYLNSFITSICCFVNK